MIRRRQICSVNKELAFNSLGFDRSIGSSESRNMAREDPDLKSFDQVSIACAEKIAWFPQLTILLSEPNKTGKLPCHA